MTSSPIWITALLVALILGATALARRRHETLLALVERRRLPLAPPAGSDLPSWIDVYLPPAFAQLPHGACALLFVNDGQDAAALGLRETLARLYRGRRLRPLIVVAVPAGARRLEHYGTAGIPNAQGFGALAGVYTKYVMDQVVPLVSRHFAPSQKPGDAGWLGASLGGLSAFDMAWEHPERFGLVGVLSGSFWWRAGPEETAVPPGELIVPARVRQAGFRPGFRVWLQAGTRDERADRDGDGVIDAIADTLDVVAALEEVGYRRDRDVVYLEIEDGRHRYETWRRALPKFLLWAFGTSWRPE